MTDITETIALAILNSDRVAHGWRPRSSRENIPDSEGYVRNARDVIAALADAGLAVVPIEPEGDQLAIVACGLEACRDDACDKAARHAWGDVIKAGNAMA